MPNKANSRSHFRLSNGANMAVSVFRCILSLILPFTWMLRLTQVLRLFTTFLLHNPLLEMLQPGMKYQQLQCYLARTFADQNTIQRIYSWISTTDYFSTSSYPYVHHKISQGITSRLRYRGNRLFRFCELSSTCLWSNTSSWSHS